MKTAGLSETLNTISSSNKYNLWLYHNIADFIKGDVLDIGSGIGDVSQHFLQSDIASLICSDNNPEFISILRKKFSSELKTRVEYLDICADDYLETIAPESVDTITCFNVLEHIADDQEALNHMHKLLKPGGKLILIVPAFNGLYGTLDSLVGHHRRYTKKSLNDVLSTADFQNNKQFYMNFFGIFTWYLSGKILKQKKFDKNACRKLDGVVPVLQALETVCKPPVGQSLVTICSKI